MKQHKMLMLDEEIVKKLDGINASSLVNKLLIEHFKGENNDNLVILKKKYEENKAILRESKRKDKEFRSKIAKIEAKEKQMLAITRQLTPEEKQKNQELWDLAKQKAKTKSLIEIKKIYLEMKGGAS